MKRSMIMLVLVGSSSMLLGVGGLWASVFGALDSELSFACFVLLGVACIQVYFVLTLIDRRLTAIENQSVNPAEAE